VRKRGRVTLEDLHLTSLPVEDGDVVCLNVRAGCSEEDVSTLTRLTAQWLEERNLPNCLTLVMTEGFDCRIYTPDEMAQYGFIPAELLKKAIQLSTGEIAGEAALAVLDRATELLKQAGELSTGFLPMPAPVERGA
jgi:hypothetical protein